MGPSILGLLSPNPTLYFFADIGMAMLLFVVGLHQTRSLAQASKKIIAVTVTQVAVVSLIGFALGKLIGLNSTESLLMGVVIAFSSTVVVVKILEEKRWTDSLHAKLAISVMLVQDLIAILALPLVGAQAEGFLIPLLKLMVLFLAAYVCGAIAVPRLFAHALKSGEVIILLSCALLFGFIALATALGFSPAIGGFLAGIMIAPYNYSLEVSVRVRPMRDFFDALFFVSLGVELVIGDALSMPLAVLAMLVVVAVIKPVIIGALSMLAGYNASTSIKTGIPLGQISEFSLIIASVGLGAGSISGPFASAITLATMTSIILTSYAVSKERSIVAVIEPMLRKYQKNEPAKKLGADPKVVLIGCDRTGAHIQKMLAKNKIPYVIVDHNPDVIERLCAKGIPCKFADESDPHFFDSLNLKSAKTIIARPQVLRRTCISQRTR